VRISRLSRLSALAAAGVIAAAAAFASSSLASTSHAKFWQNPTHKVDCGIMIGGKQVLCSSPKIPAPPHTTSQDGDPGFVSIGKTGKPTLLRLSQDSFVSDHIVTLSSGAKWSSLGVTCTLGAKSVTCKNKSGHGFEIYGPKKGYKSF
jgi:hypothetical protein